MTFLESLEQFADDLFTLVMWECYDIGGSRNITDDEPPLQGGLRWTVRLLLRYTEEVSMNIFNDLIGQGRLTSVRFRLFAAELTVSVAERNYVPYEFLLFAVLLYKLAILCHANRCGDCTRPAMAAVVEVGHRLQQKGQMGLATLRRLGRDVRASDVLRRMTDLTL